MSDFEGPDVLNHPRLAFIIQAITAQFMNGISLIIQKGFGDKFFYFIN
jgi:hypothetical protein